MRRLQCRDKLLLFPSPNERQPSNPARNQELHTPEVLYLLLSLLSDLYPISECIQAFIFKLQTAFVRQLSNAAGIDCPDISAASSSHSPSTGRWKRLALKVRPPQSQQPLPCACRQTGHTKPRQKII